jgi:hypothetical protein
MESQTFDERANDCEVTGVEELPTGDVGRGANCGVPLYLDWGYTATPGWRATSSGRETVPLFVKPCDKGCKVAALFVRREFSNAGFVVVVYCPGSNRMSVGAPGADNKAPTVKSDKLKL